MHNNTSQLLFAYWDQLRAGRRAPKRTEINPASIAEILPQTMLLECNSLDNYRFRIAGTKLCEYFGMELRGHNFLELWQSFDRKILQEKLQTVTKHCRTTVFSVQSRNSYGEIICSELLMLPLCAPDGTIHRLLGAWSLEENAPWNGHTHITEHALIAPTQANQQKTSASSKIEACHATPNANQPSPLYSRFISAQRRRFRVYDGGRP